MPINDDDYYYKCCMPLPVPTLELDYSNNVLFGLPANLIQRLQSVVILAIINII